MGLFNPSFSRCKKNDYLTHQEVNKLEHMSRKQEQILLKESYPKETESILYISQKSL